MKSRNQTKQNTRLKLLANIPTAIFSIRQPYFLQVRGLFMKHAFASWWIVVVVVVVVIPVFVSFDIHLVLLLLLQFRLRFGEL